MSRCFPRSVAALVLGITKADPGTVRPMQVNWRLPGNKIVASQAARAGIIAASANIASTFSRGLLPRSVGEQALATGVCTAAMYQAAATAHSAAETLALLLTKSHGMRGRMPEATATLAVDLAFVGVGIIADELLPARPDEALGKSITRFTADTLMLGGAAGAVVSVIDEVAARLFRGQKVQTRPLLVDVAAGGLIAGITIYARHKRAREFGLVDPQRRAIKRAGLIATGKAGLTGVAATGGMMVLVAGEQFVAHSVRRVLDERVPRLDIGSPLVGHTVAFAMLGAGGVVAFSVVKRRIEKGGDIVEPAYPQPPTNPYVTAGPRSIIPFDTIGMEGRRFVLMALTCDEITAVMRQAAIDPVRVVAGYEAADSTQERAELCLKEMEAVGAFDRSLICVASPTGVGYVSYTFAESLEYLTLGDCAIIVPQYALVPSFMALFDTHDGVSLQRKVIKLVRDRIAQMPEGKRPRLVQFGESLGAQVALDVSYPRGAGEFDVLGLAAGLYLGVPFRSTTWNSWRNAQQLFDPERAMTVVSEPAKLTHDPERSSNAPRHIMIVHDDDPVNKFTYRLIVKQPWWMGPPTTRPPTVPRETLWRPVTTFFLTLVDLMNGMDFKPGEFVRRGHDYRIDSRQATADAFQLECEPEQLAAIEHALREREQDWAARRLVARKFASARDSVTRTLKSWGVTAPTLPKFDQFGLPEVADVDPTSTSQPPPSHIHHLGSSGVT